MTVDDTWDDGWDDGWDPTWGEVLHGQLARETDERRQERGDRLWATGRVGPVRLVVGDQVSTFHASVSGTRNWECSLTFDHLDDDDLDVLDALVRLRPATTPMSSFPQEVLHWQLADIGIDLDPDLDPLACSCDCPDTTAVCKHLVALITEVAGLIDTDHWTWLQALGHSAEHRTGASNGTLEEAVAGPPLPSSATEAEAVVQAHRATLVHARLERFWGTPETVHVPLPEVPRPADRERDPELLLGALTLLTSPQEAAAALAEVEAAYRGLIATPPVPDRTVSPGQR